jgi:hypothetical protein
MQEQKKMKSSYEDRTRPSDSVLGEKEGGEWGSLCFHKTGR